MGLVVMSERELKRLEVLSQVETGKLTAGHAAHVLGVSERHVFRLVAKLKANGVSRMAHAARGRPSNNRKSDRIKEYAIGLIQDRYHDFGPTLAAEMLAEHHGLNVSRETLRKWMTEAGLWSTRSQRRRFHQPRIRRECYGELIQIDGSEHNWFEDRAPRCTLLVFIDDATSTLMHLRFVKSEDTFSYMAAVQDYLADHGRPLAFYSDKHSVFRIAQKSERAGETMTQFGRALAELQIEILCANSSQAKGRVERANRTLQDRLVKALRLEGVSTIEDANRFLPAFMMGFNDRFARQPAKDHNAHRLLNIPPERLIDVLCVKDQRYLSDQLTLTYEHKKVILEPNDITSGLVGKYVDIHVYPDGSFTVNHKGVSLPYKVFDKDQRVTHAAITENKRLSAMLEHIKAEQEKLPPPQLRRTSRRNGYVKRGRKPGPKPGTSILARRKSKEDSVTETKRKSR